MGVSSLKLVYDFYRKHNRIISGQGKSISLVDVVAYLNEAQEIWYENRVFIAQTNQKVRNDLRVFMVPKHKLSCANRDDKCCFAKYPSNLYKRLNQLAITSNEECCPGISKEIIPRILQSDDLHEARRNPYRVADFFFEQLNAVETNGGILVYHDGNMAVNELFIDYYRKPLEIHAPTHEECVTEGYYMYDGRLINSDQDFEVQDTYAANDVVNIAVLLSSRDVRDVEGFNTQLAQILQTQALLKGV